MNPVFDIRGGFGTQLLTMLTLSAYHKISVSHIVFRVNIGGYPGDLSYMAAIDAIRLSQYLNTHVEFSDQMNKTSIFREPYMSTLASKTVRQINPFTLPEEQYNSYIHVRGNDRKLLSDEDFQRLMDKHPSFEVIREPGQFQLVDSLNSTVEDFFRFYSAKEIVGPYSTYTLAAAILNEGVDLHIVPPSESNGPDKMSDEDWKFVDRMVQSYDNIHWYSHENW